MNEPKIDSSAPIESTKNNLRPEVDLIADRLSALCSLEVNLLDLCREELLSYAPATRKFKTKTEFSQWAFLAAPHNTEIVRRLEGTIRAVNASRQEAEDALAKACGK